MIYEKKFPTMLIMPMMLLLLISCAGLKINPPSPDKQTILVLPAKITNTSLNTRYFYDYIYEIVSADSSDITYLATFKLPIKDDLLIVDSLPPGNYIVNKFIFLPRGAGDHTYGNNVKSRNDRFKLESGKITVLSRNL